VPIGYYPCQTCWPQPHCTVSVGTFFVNCCLQTGQGLVITYVIPLFSRARAVCRKTSARCVPEERLRQRLRTYSIIELRNKELGPCKARFVPIRDERNSLKAHIDSFCLRVSAAASCRDTGVSVAQIFSVPSRKFRSLARLNRLRSTKHRLAGDGTTRALTELKAERGHAWTFTLRKLVSWRSLSAKAESCAAKPPSNYVTQSRRYETCELSCLIFRKYAP